MARILYLVYKVVVCSKDSIFCFLWKKVVTQGRIDSSKGPPNSKKSNKRIHTFGVPNTNLNDYIHSMYAL